MAGKKMMMDGNQAAAYISYAFTEVAAIFPITPSSPMAELVDEWAAGGKTNLFGQPVRVIEMQSEGGAAGTVHGSLQAGALTSTYTASQGLLLMIPNMYKIAGELLPGVFHVSARTLSSHALSIFGDHSDVMACRGTGFAMLASASPQEAMDLGAVAHLTAISARVPFLHFFDGFRTSHEIQKIEALDYADLEPFIDRKALAAFRANSMNPEHPITRGTTVNPDIFFQCREAANDYVERVPELAEGYMQRLAELTGRRYNLFDYYGDVKARRVIVCMGSVAETAKETVDALLAAGESVGLLQVRLFRPFSARHFLAALPDTVESIAVLDRCKDGGAPGEPLFLDVSTVLAQSGRRVTVAGGRFGLSSKDTTPAQIAAVFKNLESAEPKTAFTIGINDDVFGSALPVDESFAVDTRGVVACKLWGIGSDGTVGANKNTIKIIGNTTDLFCQAYFAYDSKKSGGLTQSHLRFSTRPIRAPYLVSAADIVACHKASYVNLYDMASDLKRGGTFLLNCEWSPKELGERLPARLKRALSEKDARLFIINADAAAREIGIGDRTNTILQAAFFKLMDVIPLDTAIEEMEHAIKSTYIKKGSDVVELNLRAIRRGLSDLVSVEIPPEWANAADDGAPAKREAPEFIREVVEPMNRQKGDALPVSAFRKYGLFDGSWPNGTAQYEKRGMATAVPCWDSAKCIQCNRCSLVCSHAAIRPVLLSAAELREAPDGFEAVPANGAALKGYAYRLQVSPLDCTGCGSCVNVCPAKTKALSMSPLDSQLSQAANWDYAVNTVTVKKDACQMTTVKGSQFAKPYFEFSGACGGCGETPYIKLLTQLFGDRMFIANASGCSSAYGGSTPSTPYTRDKDGRGPTWAMSLFEDNAEYMFGLYQGYDAVHRQIRQRAEALLAAGVAAEACARYLECADDAALSEDASRVLLSALESADENGDAAFILANREYMTKKSFWALGGDGWAYDIGYGGLDHVLASGRNVNMLVLDTEVYSNTGGQASKATAAAAIAKFAAGGKETKKKDLGLLAMSYGNVYVAQVAMGFDPKQTLDALREAEAYDGPSIVIAYCPCIEHGIRAGMGKSQEEMKKAVEAGYWQLYRYDPSRAERALNPFTLDSPKVTGDVIGFLKEENRFAALQTLFPEKAERLYARAASDAEERRARYAAMSKANADTEE